MLNNSLYPYPGNLDIQRRCILRKLVLTAVSLSLVPGCLLALGLGQLQVQSSLYQPLQARIPLVLSADEPLGEIKIKLASELEFAQQHIPRPAYLTQLQFKALAIDDKPFVQITTQDEVVEPAMNFLLEVEAPTGKYINAYTVLLDPNNNSPGTEISYGPVRADEMLWDIAAKLKPAHEASLTQTIAALFLKNPQAFAHGNLNGLKVGQQLQIPSPAEIKALSQQQALALIEEHRSAWQDKVKEPQTISALSSSSQGLEPGKEQPKSSEQNTLTSGAKMPLNIEQDLAQTQQAYAELKQAHAQLESQLGDLKLKNTQLATEMQAKTGQVVELQTKVNELSQTLKSKSNAWGLSKWLMGLFALAGLAFALLKIRNKSMDRKTAALQFNWSNLKENLNSFLNKLKQKASPPETVVEPQMSASVSNDVAQLSESNYNYAERPVDFNATTTQTSSAIEPLEEAGIYFVYGRYEQAEKVLLSALEKQPERQDLQQKLLEVYAAKDDRAAFEYFADQIRLNHPTHELEFLAFIHDLYHKTWPEQQQAATVEDSTPLADTASSVEVESGANEIREQVEVNSFQKPSPMIELADEDLVTTKLEMARSCIEIGAVTDAKKLLQEVQKMGDATQRSEAERLLQKITS